MGAPTGLYVEVLVNQRGHANGTWFMPDEGEPQERTWMALVARHSGATCIESDDVDEGEGPGMHRGRGQVLRWNEARRQVAGRLTRAQARELA